MGCPSNTISSTGSDDITDCICDVGFEGGLVGVPCSACEVGNFKVVNGSGSCTPCSAGSYQDVMAASACASCPANTNSLLGSDEITDCICEIGYNGADGTQCSACAEGKYKEVNGSATCADCAAGSYQNMTAASVCMACPSNTDSPMVSTSLEACICNAGFSGPDGGACSECGVGTYKGTTGSASCLDCNAGSYLNISAGTACFACPSNTDAVRGSVQQTECVCNAGYTGPDGGTCTVCDVGTFKSASGSAMCMDCQAATYNDLAGSSACMSCPAFTTSFARSDQVADCICEEGYSGPDGGVCTACDPGTFKNINGSSGCIDCAINTYQSETAASACVSCPADHSYAFVGSASVQECLCNVGYQGNGDTCTACSMGTFKAVNGSTPCQRCSPGTYLNATSGTACFACPFASTSTRGSDDVRDCTCSRGYTGPDGGQCVACGPGTFKSVSGSGPCNECGVGSYAAASAGTSCSACAPFTTTEGRGSPDAASCLCLPGYSGPDGGSCTACAAGTYKVGNGSATCVGCGQNATTMASAAEALEACVCIPGTFGPNGGVCELCPEDSWCPGGSSRFDCPASASAPQGRSMASACECNAGYAGPAGGTCNFCEANYYCPGGNVTFPCTGNSVSDPGSVRAAQCYCPVGFALLFNFDCQVLTSPRLVGSGTALSSGTYVGMARVALAPPSFSNVSIATGNDTLTCESSMAAHSMTLFETTTIRAQACALDGAVGPVQETTFTVAEGATVVLSFVVSGNVNGNVFGRSLAALLSTFFRIQAYQIRTVVTDTRRRHLLAASVSASMVAADQSEFDALSSRASSITTDQVTNLAQAASGDNSLVASALDVQMIEGALADVATPTPSSTPESEELASPDDDDGPNFNVGAVVGASVACGLLLTAAALFLLRRTTQGRSGQADGELVYARDSDKSDFSSHNGAIVGGGQGGLTNEWAREVWPRDERQANPLLAAGYVPVYTPDPAAGTAPPAVAQLAFPDPSGAGVGLSGTLPGSGPGVVMHANPALGQYVTAPSVPPMAGNSMAGSAYPQFNPSTGYPNPGGPYGM